MPDAIQAATALILELCGGEPGTVTAAGAEPHWQRDATMRFARIAELRRVRHPAGRGGRFAGTAGLRGAPARRGTGHRRGAILAQ